MPYNQTCALNVCNDPECRLPTGVDGCVGNSVCSSLNSNELSLDKTRYSSFSHRRNCMFTLALLSLLAAPVAGWGSSSSGQTDYSIYGNDFARDWLYDGSTLSVKVEGCVVGYVADSEEVGCLEDESEEGTTNWYMMANCQRPQVAFSVYASSSGGCSGSNFKETFITTSGLSEFLYSLSNYDPNYAYGGEGEGGEDNELPDCENGDYGYVGLDCANDGSFALNYFEDQYCLTRTGNQYDSLDDTNSILSNYKSCYTASQDQDNGYTFIHYLIAYAESCSSLDYSYCTDNSIFKSRSSGNAGGKSASTSRKWTGPLSGAHKSWVTKLKYVVGGMFLLASFIMFTGILFTNRRRRRAMMMRKYRQSRKEKSRDKRGDSSRKSRASSKRRSRTKSKDGRGEGVFT